MYSDNDDDDEPQTSGLCCLGGCLTGCAFCVLLLIILPAGVLLTFYASNNKDYGVLSAGICLIAVPLMSVPVVLIVFLNRRRIRRFRKRKVLSKVQKDEERTGNQTRY
ncbi:hypothetical protein FSP39_013834 [Pinctada imbricata]|uniref:Transmembrane protein n=1 Tax=Pinctada imbricata TaxID=66713 RepID=A0AA88YR65_PINIB|nr:hypothetical protein FSP39_013834 [Pinctada imbricata]